MILLFRGSKFSKLNLRNKLNKEAFSQSKIILSHNFGSVKREPYLDDNWAKAS